MEYGDQQHLESDMEHSQLACPGAAIANFRFGIFALEPPKDL